MLCGIHGLYELDALQHKATILGAARSLDFVVVPIADISNK